jgi:hypothetical protein
MGRLGNYTPSKWWCPAAPARSTGNPEWLAQGCAEEAMSALLVTCALGGRCLRIAGAMCTVSMTTILPIRRLELF